MTLWRAWLRGGGWPLTAALVGACSFVGDSSFEQCVDDGECLARLGAPPPGAVWRCLDSVCEPAEAETSGCLTSADCAGAFADDPAQFRGPAFCDADGACQPIVDTANRTCRAVNYIDGEDQVVLGVLAPTLWSDLSGFGAEPAVARALELVNTTGVGPSLEEVNVAAIVCASDPEMVGGHVRFLVDELGVAAILTAQTSSELATTFGSVDPEGPLIVATANHDEALAGITDPGGLYLAGVDTFQSLLPAFVAAIPLASKRAVNLLQGAISEDEVRHVAVASASENSLGRAQALDEMSDVEIEGFEIAFSEGPNTFVDNLKAGIKEPDVIYVLTEDTRFVDEVLPVVEARLDTKPVYVLGPAYRANDALPDVAGLSADAADLDSRMLGIEHFTDRTAFDTFASSTYGPDEVHLGYHVLFDAIIAVSLAAHQTIVEEGDPRVGAELAARMLAFGSGDPSMPLVDQPAVTDAFNRATDGLSVYPRGTSGDWVFNPAERARSMAISGYCLVPRPMEELAWDFSLGQLAFDGMAFDGRCW